MENNTNFVQRIIANSRKHHAASTVVVTDFIMPPSCKY